jgi:hypothetical protein
MIARTKYHVHRFISEWDAPDEEMMEDSRAECYLILLLGRLKVRHYILAYPSERDRGSDWKEMRE